MKTVTSLPTEVIADGEIFVLKYKRVMLAYAAPAFTYFLTPEALSIQALVLLTLFYVYVVCLSKLARILWSYERLVWCQLFLSLIFGLLATVFFRYFDLTHWLIHEFGYFPDDGVKQFYVAAAFIPFVAAYFGSFKKVELAFYKSKGFDYKGWVGGFDGL